MNVEKILYACKCKINAYEYGEMSKYFPQIYWLYVFNGTILNVVLTVIVGIFSRNIILTSMCFLFYQLIIMIFYRIRLRQISERIFHFLDKKRKIFTDINMEFYDKYLVINSEKTNVKINYEDIKKSVETDRCFYIKYRKKIGIIQKGQCSLELIRFLRKKLINLENKLCISDVIKGEKFTNNPKFIKTMMNILFVFTIVCLGLESYSESLIAELLGYTFLDEIKIWWVCLLWLPIPVLSIILGIKYRKKGYKCFKNIIAGSLITLFFVSILISFFLTSYYSNYNNEYNYSNIYMYEDMINIDLPEEGVLRSYQDIYVEEYDIKLTCFITYYDGVGKEITDRLVENIKKNDKWFLNSEKESELETVMLFNRSKGDLYYSIYNETLDEYNKLPMDNGNYHMYIMRYSVYTKTLYIYSFIYSQS